MPSNYSLFKNASARSARLNNQSDEDSDELSPRPARRSSFAGSAARAMRLADEERKRQQAESAAPGGGERAEHSIQSDQRMSVGLRAGGGTPFERAAKPEAEPAPVDSASVDSAPGGPAAAPEKKSDDSGVFSKLFSLIGGRK